MKTEKKITKECIGGQKSIITEIEDTCFRGEELGSAISEGAEIVTEAVDHIERVTESEIIFAEGRIAKNKVRSLVWHRDAFGTQSVRFVRMEANCAQ